MDLIAKINPSEFDFSSLRYKYIVICGQNVQFLTLLIVFLLNSYINGSINSYNNWNSHELAIQQFWLKRIIFGYYQV